MKVLYEQGYHGIRLCAKKKKKKIKSIYFVDGMKVGGVGVLLTVRFRSLFTVQELSHNWSHYRSWSLEAE